MEYYLVSYIICFLIWVGCAYSLKMDVTLPKIVLVVIACSPPLAINVVIALAVVFLTLFELIIERKAKVLFSFKKDKDYD